MPLDKDSVKRKAKPKDATGSSPHSVLPKCQICGNQATGYHYGANTCEACKAFFRRTLVKKDTKFSCICSEQEKREAQAGFQKTPCPSCRYKRCLEAGMSKDAVKIGRYTHTWKTRNMKEVNKSDGRKQQSDSPSSQSHSPMSMSPPSPPQSESSASASSPESSMSPPEQPTSNLHIPAMKKCTCAVTCAVHSIFALTRSEDIDSASEDMSITELEQLVQTLCLAQEKLSLREQVPSNQANVVESIKKYYEEYELRKEIFGEMSDLSYEEFTTFYQQTGIDLDNRLGILKDHVTCMEEKLYELVKFAKSIPGFKGLPMKDQENLIKASRCESSLLGYYRSFNPSLKVMMCDQTGKICHIDKMKKLLGAEFVDAKIEILGKIQNMTLGNEEEALIRGIVIMYTDRCELECPGKIQEVQYKLIQCLQYVIQKQYGTGSNRIARIFSLLTSLRDFTDWDAQIMKEMVIAYPMSQNYPIVRELLM